VSRTVRGVITSLFMWWNILADWDVRGSWLRPETWRRSSQSL